MLHPLRSRDKAFRLLIEARRLHTTLAYEEVAAAPKAAAAAARNEPLRAVVVHGLLGQGRNWRTWSRRLAAAAAEATQRSWSVLLVDQRCHGASTRQQPGFKPPHTLAASASDIAQLCRAHFGGRSPDMLIGHSLGGKVALEYLAQRAAGLELPKQVWVLDSNPGLLPKDTSDVARVMQEIGSIGVPVPSRELLVGRLKELGFSEELRLWLGSNLVINPSGHGLVWTFELDGARQLYEDYKATQHWDLLAHPPPGVHLRLVRAAKSDRWSKQMEEKLETAAVAAAKGAGTAEKGTLHVHTLPNAGHWLHVDNPDGLLHMVLEGAKAAARHNRSW